MTAFERFGWQHLTVLLLTAAASVLLVMAVRRWRAGPFHLAVRIVLALTLLVPTVVFLVQASRRRDLQWWDFAPLQLCDMAIFVAVFALVTRHALAAEVLYFWAGAGTLVAMISPDLAYAFPAWEFVFFFGLHAAVVLSAAVLTFGFDRRPRPRAAWRVFLLTNAYAAVVGLVNVLTGSNFMYLRAKPNTPSILDWFGPWPYYLLGAEVLALVLFLALEKAAGVRYSPDSPHGKDVGRPSENKEQA